ncbi:hypothetical protein RF11_09159 [Thelohanellus kitauei]|uniref:Uncharacterized protein n=1 Tax=Thelohanellus kitauei TaxID=669202 RepID=A0A0C2N4A7_THEKT|nr:hypothetical protein RF11_09159 [Thelohanellus kitauei]
MFHDIIIDHQNKVFRCLSAMALGLIKHEKYLALIKERREKKLINGGNHQNTLDHSDNEVIYALFHDKVCYNISIIRNLLFRRVPHYSSKIRGLTPERKNDFTKTPMRTEYAMAYDGLITFKIFRRS